MKSKTILIYRDRPRLQLQTLLENGVQADYATTIHEARKEFDRLTGLDAVVVDVQDNVERGLEFCEIVHVNRPALPILFVRSIRRASLEPYCAARIVAPEISEDELAREILDLLDPTGERKQA